MTTKRRLYCQCVVLITLSVIGLVCALAEWNLAAAVVLVVAAGLAIKVSVAYDTYERARRGTKAG